MAETPSQDIDTPYGTLHAPKSVGVQFAVLATVFVGGLVIGNIVGRALGGVSDAAQVFLYLPFLAILFLGYALWVARLQAIAFDGMGRGILKALFSLFVKRQKPKGLQDVIPSEEKLREMAVRAQKAAWSFLTMSVPIGGGAVLIAAFFDAHASFALSIMLVGGTCIAWGYVLSLLGRSGYLPLPEGEG